MIKMTASCPCLETRLEELQKGWELVEMVMTSAREAEGWGQRKGNKETAHAKDQLLKGNEGISETCMRKGVSKLKMVGTTKHVGEGSCVGNHQLETGARDRQDAVVCETRDLEIDFPKLACTSVFEDCVMGYESRASVRCAEHVEEAGVK